MESNVPVIAKRVWNMLRVVFFMLRKGISKGKLMMDLNMMLKRRGKIAGKAISNLVFHHHHGGSTSSHHRFSDDSHLQYFSAPREYEFSCSNTPNNFFPIGKRHRNNRNHNHSHSHSHSHFFTCAHAPITQDQDDEMVTANAVKEALEMLNNTEVMVEAVAASPALPGFGRSPLMARQLRVTDSPFPLQNADEDSQVDKAAEEFIKRFYKQLRKQD